MQKTLLLFLIVLIFISCNRKKSILDYTDLKYDITSLFKPTNINEDSLSRPEFVLSIGDYIIIGDDSKDNIIIAYNLVDNTYRNLITKGNGANEIRGISRLNKSNDSEFYAYDGLTQKIFYFNIQNNEIHFLKSEKMSDYSTFAKTEDYIIGCRKNSAYRYTIKNGADSIIGEIGDYSEFKVSITIGAEVFDGFITNNNNIKKSAWVSCYAESINILDYNDKLKILHKNVYKQPKYGNINQEGKDTPVFSMQNNIGFTSVCNSDNYIFALYNGKPFIDFIKNPNKDNLICNNICVFDWNAKLITNLYSDNGIRCIDYNRSKNKLFFIVLSNNDMYQIMEIDLQELNNKLKQLLN